MNTEIDRQCIDTLRFLSVDAVQNAGSGHPGLPLDAAPMAYVLWTRHFSHNPTDSNWFNRDRFVLSAGHGSALLYSLLYVTGYGLTLDDLRSFRKTGSRTPGHPERGMTPGVETTTGPLGQGFANGVGIALAEAQLAARFNRPAFDIIDHYTFGIVSDGDLMEGVSQEAASLAGHLGLGKLIYLYDMNEVTLSAGTGIAFTENVEARFRALGWDTVRVSDGNDVVELDSAIRAAKEQELKPSLILVRTHLGFGSPLQDSYKAHGEPLGSENVTATKRNLDWPEEPAFSVPDRALEYFRKAVDEGRKAEDGWNALRSSWAERYPELASELELCIESGLPEGWDDDIPSFPVDAKGLATRVASGKVMNALAPRLPHLTGGSADLDPSTHTALAGFGDFERPGLAEPPSPDGKEPQGSTGGGWSYAGRNIHFGVREHAMGAVLNGMAAHGGLIPYGSTFLIFSDYMRPPMRLAALMKVRVIYVFTHDSIGLGQDGPTHQPVEQLEGLRAVPNMIVIRPCDANETAEAWRIAIQIRRSPVCIVCTRQNVPTLDRSVYAPASLLSRGGYILEDAPGGKPDLILIATGSEVQLIVEAGKLLRERGVNARLVSMPCRELFDAESESWKEEVLPAQVRKRLAVEAGSTNGWWKYVGLDGDVLGIDRFGESGPGTEVLKEYGFTADNVVRRALALAGKRMQTI